MDEWIECKLADTCQSTEGKEREPLIAVLAKQLEGQ